MAKKLKYYSLAEILKTNSLYYLIFGQRSNGKTYSVLEYMIKQKIKTGKPAVLIRRRQEEMRTKFIKDYFLPFTYDTVTETNKVYEMSKGKYNHISYYGGTFFIGTFDFEEMKWIEKDTLCITASLSTYANAKGADRGDISCILFDEFISRDYLVTEWSAFMNMVSTFVRNRDGIPVFLVGNSISLYCPYFREFGINIKELDQGKIYTYDYGKEKVSVQWAESLEGSDSLKYFLGSKSTTAKMISTGKMEIPCYPHYEKSIDFRNDVLKRFYISFDDDFCCMNIIKNVDGLFIYVHNCNKIPDYSDVYTFTATPLNDVKNCQAIRQGSTRAHVILRQLLEQGKIYFNDNSTGEFFSAWYKWQMNYSPIIKR